MAKRTRTSGSRSRFRAAPKNRRRRTRRAYFRRYKTPSLWATTRITKLKLVVPGVISPANPNPLLAAIINQTNAFDPLGTTQQPLGFDQWAGLYNKFKVLGGRVTATFHNAGAAAVMVGITREKEGDDTAGNNPWDYLAERPATRMKLLTPDVDKCTVVHKWSVKKNFSITNIRDCDDLEVDLTLVTPAPARTARMEVWGARHNGSTAAVPIDYTVKVEYLILWYDAKTPARSTV